MDIRTNVLYTYKISDLTVRLESGKQINVTDSLKSGRTNYGIFQMMLEHYLPLTATSKVDLEDEAGNKYEVKSFHDDVIHPKQEWFHTAASCCFGPNNKGPLIKYLLETKEFEAAFEVCKEKSYDEIDYFIYTNSSGFDNSEPCKFVIIKKEDALKMLNPEDPRLISRKKLLDSCTETITLD